MTIEEVFWTFVRILLIAIITPVVSVLLGFGIVYGVLMVVPLSCCFFIGSLCGEG
jgi:hypothetical protein